MENASRHPSLTATDITFQLLEQITSDFSEEHRIGSGGYGHVYKGVLNGDQIAVKKLHPLQGLDDVQFKNELNNLMRVQHHNIVRLVAYCYETRHRFIEHNGEFVFGKIMERALCFEYIEGGSLHKHLSEESGALDWQTCYKIIKGISEGLDYLHTGSKDHIYHLDLKPENILLDNNMVPKIADFGLSRVFDKTITHATKTFIGTMGYMPPEYIEKREISNKFDVFSLGIIIIKIMTGLEDYSKSVDMTSQKFVELVLENWRKRLRTASTSEQGDWLEVKTCIEIALRCVETDRAKRPTIKEIVDKLHELDNARRTRISQSPGSWSKECLGVDPLELRFPFELRKEMSCVLQLTNRTDNCIAFIAKTNQAKYHIQPDHGIMPPWSKRYIIVTLQAQVTAPPNMQCNDMFLVQSRRVSEDVTLDNIAEHFNKMSICEGMDSVNEAKLPIVYVELPQP